MKHIMRLHNEPFEMVDDESKTTEYRLNDPKRQKITIGDTITFYKLPEEIEKVEVIVTRLRHYKTLLDMYAADFDIAFKNRYPNPQAVVDDTPYYTEEKVKKYGCLAIDFKKNNE